MNLWNAQRRAEIVAAVESSVGLLGWPVSAMCDDLRNLAHRRGLPRPPAHTNLRTYINGLTGNQLVKLSEALDIAVERAFDADDDAFVEPAERAAA